MYVVGRELVLFLAFQEGNWSPRGVQILPYTGFAASNRDTQLVPATLLLAPSRAKLKSAGSVSELDFGRFPLKYSVSALLWECGPFEGPKIGGGGFRYVFGG